VDAYLSDASDTAVASDMDFDKDSLEILVQRIRDGETGLRDILIEQCLPFLRMRTARL